MNVSQRSFCNSVMVDLECPVGTNSRRSFDDSTQRFIINTIRRYSTARVRMPHAAVSQSYMYSVGLKIYRHFGRLISSHVGGFEEVLTFD